MTELRKAAEMALEVLEDIFGKEKKDVGAINALRQALAQPDTDLDEAIKRGTKAWADVDPTKWVDGLRGEPEQEWIEDGFGTMWQKCGEKDCGKFVVKIGKVDCWNGDCPENKPKREWVGLTDEDKHYLNEVLNLQGRFPIIETIEAKLKEKNT